MNKAIVVGNVGQDPKINRGNTGKRTAIFSVATSEKWKNAQGEPQESTEWHNVFVLAEHAANFTANYIRKGDHVVVEGQLQTKEYTDRDGIKRKATSIVVKPLSGSIGLLKSANPNATEANIVEENSENDENYPDHIPF